MREKLMTLPLKELQQIAKANHIRYTGLRKAELVDRLCMLDSGQSDSQTDSPETENPPAGLQENQNSQESVSASEPYPVADAQNQENGENPGETSQPRRQDGAEPVQNSERSYRPRRSYGSDSAQNREYDASSERTYRPRRQYRTEYDQGNDGNSERNYRPRRQYGAESAESRWNDGNSERSYRSRRPYGAEAAENQGYDGNSERGYRPRRSYGAEVMDNQAGDTDLERNYRPQKQYERRNSDSQSHGVSRVALQESYRIKQADIDTYDSVEELHQEYTDPAEELQKSYAAIAEEEPEEAEEEVADYEGGEPVETRANAGESAEAESLSDNDQASENYGQTSAGESRENGANPPRRTRTFSYESDEETCGILEIMPDGYGFIRCHNYLPGEEDVYVAPSQIRKFNLKTGDFLRGKLRVRREGERFGALAFLEEVNNASLAETAHRTHFEDLTPIFPDERIYLETSRRNLAMRIVDIVSPVGKGQRGMIVSPPKAGKTTLLKEIARSVTVNYPDIHLIILLIDERPEEVTDIKEAIQGDNVEVVYSTFDELPEHHKRVSEMAIERAKRLVEQKKDVMILLDSVTRLARAYNLTIAPSGRTLSGGLDPAALYMPKKFFGAARNIREGGSLTILATALIETGSRMDDMIFEEFKGTGNMELVLDRRLSERRVFPAIDLLKSGTRRDDLIMTREEKEASDIIRRLSNSSRQDDMLETVMNLFYQTRDNQEFIKKIKVTRL